MANELRAVLRELGGKRVLGRSLSSDSDLREAIREGFPHAVLEELMRASGLTLKELANALDLSACSPAAADVWPGSSRTGFTAWRGCWLWPAKSWETARALVAGSGAAIALWAACRRFPPSTPNSEPVRWKIFSAALPTVALVDASVSRAACGLRACTL